MPNPAAPTRFGNYDVLGPLGVGGMASVYRARVREGRRAGALVALKQLQRAICDNAYLRELFEREAALAQLLDHPHIIKVYESGELSGQSYMAMELVEGVDLGRLLARCRTTGVKVPHELAAFLTHALLEALAYAHTARSPRGSSLDVVHCDVSPSNVFISDSGDVKLGDFGVATWRMERLARKNPTGKPFYLSPEALDGKVTPGADLWATGVVLYELLTGELPFKGDTVEAVHAAIRAGQWMPVRQLREEVPEALMRVLERAFATRPEDRFATAQAMADALQPALDPAAATPLALASFVRGTMGPPRDGASPAESKGPAPAVYRFAFLLHSSVDVGFVSSVLVKLKEELAERLFACDLYGQAASGDVIVLLQLSTSTRTITWRLEQEALRLHGKLIDLQALDASGRERFQRRRVDACEVHLEATRDPVAATRTLAEQMGLGAEPSQGVIHLKYDSAQDLWTAYVRAVAEGTLFLAHPRAPAVGTEVRLTFSVPGMDTLACRAVVKAPSDDPAHPGFHAELQPSHAFLEFVAKQRSERKAGRSTGTAGGARAFPRYDTCLEVEFRNYPELSAEYATNISKGGLFVRTSHPPDLHAMVKLLVKLPSGESVETEAEVVHVVTPEVAEKFRLAPGAGLSFRVRGEAFHEPFSRLIAEYQARRPRVLTVDHDSPFRAALARAITDSGLEADVVADPTEAFQRLVSDLFAYDLLVVATGDGGDALIDQVRRVGGESDLRIVRLVDGDELKHGWLKGPQAANDVVGKERPLDDVVKRLLQVLGRSQ